MLEPRGIPTKQGLICAGFLACQQSKFLHERGERYVRKTRFIMYEVSGMRADAENMAPIAALNRLRTLQSTSDSIFPAVRRSYKRRFSAYYAGILPKTAPKRLCKPSTHPRFKNSFFTELMTCLKSPYFASIFRFATMHVRYMSIDVGTAHNHSPTAIAHTLFIALTSGTSNSVSLKPLLMSDSASAPFHCALCCHLCRTPRHFSCRTPCNSHAPNI